LNILVAGGAGYIGSVTAKMLLDAGHHIVVYDNLSRGHRDSVSKGIKFVHGELSDISALRNTFRNCKTDAVFHFSAYALVGESVDRPDLYYENNLVTGKRILDAMVGEGVNYMVFSSTCAVFGTPAKLPIEENDRKNPESPYGETKLAFERLLKWYRQSFGISFTVLRYFNAAGAAFGLGEDHRPETHLIPLVLRAANNQMDCITIFGDDYETHDGTCIRDYIHIFDLAKAHLLAIENYQEGERYYNLGYGQGYSVREVIEAARRVTGRKIPEKIGPRRMGDPPELVASCEKIKKELGWNPSYKELDRIIESAWRWHLAYPNGYQK